MASGLDNLFTTYGNDYGALGATQAGQRRGLADMATQLSNERSAAETARYSAQTPDSNRVLAAQATAGELGNLQGQADQAAGVHGANSQKTVAQARLEAEKAKAAFDQLPAETQAKFHNGVREKNEAMLNNLEQVLTQTGNTQDAIAYIESEYPDVIKDQGWNQAKKQASNMSPEEFLKQLRSKKASLASSRAYGSPEFQGKMVQQDALLASQERQQRVQADATIGAARERGSAESKPTAEQFVYKQLQAMYPNESSAQIAKRYMDYKTIQTKMQAGIVPELDSTVTTTKGGAGGGQPAAPKRYNAQTKRWE